MPVTLREGHVIGVYGVTENKGLMSLILKLGDALSEGIRLWNCSIVDGTGNQT